ncbi:diguanylate cyclase (GGDEF) domain-containing protein [Salisediminibacterium halotolerans]|uniref:Diguanylate cyclase (GGDEF) domain-containing protein n=1 Tax=Salisediminibacterium halotolerans TaxID=517425 RepID=A0A1H9R4T3_9BACI|nr:diguanylate cyclase (GGDEF) domain-containing protein [Salisediminibacterium haloalkalitolerans]
MRKVSAVYFLWLLLFPLFAYYSFEQSAGIIQEHWFSIVLFCLLIALISLFPIQMRQSALVPFQGVSLAVFLHYGFFVEFFITQLAVITIMLRTVKHRDDLYRLPLNSLMFGLTSAGAAIIFHLSGGKSGNISASFFSMDVLPIFLYVITFYGLNHFLLYLLRRYYVGYEEIRFFDESLKWDLLSASFVLPFGIILAILYEMIGGVAFLLLGFPLLSAAVVSKTFYKSQTLNDLLKQVSVFGQEMNTLTDEDLIIQRFSETCREIFGCDEIFMYDPDEYSLDGLRTVYIRQFTDRQTIEHSGTDEVSEKVCQRGKPLNYGTKSERKHLDRDLISPEINSVLSVPAVRNNQVTGIITLLSEKKNNYTTYDVMLLEILANHLTVAVQNARHLKDAREESHRCRLTNLYNFRYFEQLLLDEFDHVEKTYAIILLDLDHFKVVNDSHGHHAGNIVLKQVAEVIREQVGDIGVAARYGGEEFVILLPEYSTEEAAKIAEKLRISLEMQLFNVTTDLADRERAAVRLTASIGVADNTKSDDHPISVLRNADRAMYVGAKNKGRNKVSTFGA